MSEADRFWCHEARNVRCVRKADYDALAADNQRLREALEKIKFRAGCFVEDDADMRPHSSEVISDIAKTALAAKQ